MPLWADSIRLVALYIAANAFIMLILSMLVVRARVKTETPIGDGGNPVMRGIMRAHENNTEYVPVPLIMLLLVLMLGGTWLPIHLIGGTLTLGRILHAIGLSRHTGPSLLRLIGMALTWLSIIIGIVALVFLVFVPRG
jgi:hypothetical protein